MFVCAHTVLYIRTVCISLYVFVSVCSHYACLFACVQFMCVCVCVFVYLYLVALANTSQWLSHSMTCIHVLVSHVVQCNPVHMVYVHTYVQYLFNTSAFPMHSPVSWVTLATSFELAPSEAVAVVPTDASLTLPYSWW